MEGPYGFGIALLSQPKEEGCLDYGGTCYLGINNIVLAPTADLLSLHLPLVASRFGQVLQRNM